MAINIGHKAPNFTALTTTGEIDLYKWMGTDWALLFSHPADFTPVCTSELSYLAKMKDEFDRRRVKILGLSVDTLQNHMRWLEDIQQLYGVKLNFPVIADPDRKVADLYNMIQGNGNVMTTGRSAIVIDPLKTVRLIMTYPESTGRNFHEVLRAIDSLTLTSEYQVATPVNWVRGEDVFILPNLSRQEATRRFPSGWQERNHYTRVVADPIA
jgi:alkyl hydroperoxide reductase subunit AhpC